MAGNLTHQLLTSPSTCGLAEELEKEKSRDQISSQPKSACGNVSIWMVTQYSQRTKAYTGQLQLYRSYCPSIVTIGGHARLSPGSSGKTGDRLRVCSTLRPIGRQAPVISFIWPLSFCFTRGLKLPNHLVCVAII